MQPADAHGGVLADNLTGFGRALRRGGVPVDSARMALAQEAALLVGLDQRADVAAALESVLIGREQDRLVFRELFDMYFREPSSAGALPAPDLPTAAARAGPARGSPRAREALAPPPGARPPNPPPAGTRIEFDAAMTASALACLRRADFNAMTADEYRLVERLAREIRLPLPDFAARRARPGGRGPRLDWPGVLRDAARLGGEVVRLPRLQRRRQPLPLMVLVDVSGSMERYARLLLAFLHAATRQLRRRDVFAFGTRLTDLQAAMRCSDGDQMLALAGAAMEDFGGGTQLGQSLAGLRRHHARGLVGNRTLVLLVTDGLDTGEPQDLARELDWLRRHCRRLVWLNPLLRFDGYAPLARGAAVLHARAHGMLAVHNLEKLEDLAASLAKALAR